MNTAELTVNTSELLEPKLQGLQRFAVAIGVIGLILSVIGGILNPAGFFHSYLFGYLFWMGATGGALILLMVHHVVGGGWGYVIRRFLEAATRLLPLMLILFIPVLIGLFVFGLYSGTPAHPGWYGPQAQTIPALRTKISYLNPTGFIIRTVLYFVLWWFLAHFLNQWGNRQDVQFDIQTASRLNYLSSWGLILYALTGTFAAIDWVMSLTPTWYSTIFGLLFLVSQVLTGMALMLVLFAYLAGRQPQTEEVPRGYFRDLGNLLLTFIMLWAYMSFSQYLLTFTGDSTDEVTWYVIRAHNGWGLISLALIPIHFFLPFMVLLVGSGIKRDPVKLGWVAFYVILMRLLDVWWWVAPTFRSHIYFTFADAGAPLLLGGIWLWMWAWQVKGKPMVPVHDPRIAGRWQEVIEHG